MDPQTLDEFKRQLHELGEQIEALADARREAGSTVEADQGRSGRLSRMDALQGQAMARAGQQRAEQVLKQIDAALKRIEDGDYGVCLDCGADIPDARLRADPTAALCIRCAEAREKGG